MLTAACWWDIQKKRIPNRLCLLGWIISFFCSVADCGIMGIRAWFLGSIIPFFVYLILYKLGAVGAGDVKLIAVAGSFLGGEAASFLSMSALAAGAVASCFHLIRRGCLISHLHSLADYFHTCILHRCILPLPKGKERILFSFCILAAVFLWYIREAGGLF